jgi:hypothetical protein
LSDTVDYFAECLNVSGESFFDRLWIQSTREIYFFGSAVPGVGEPPAPDAPGGAVPLFCCAPAAGAAGGAERNISKMLKPLGFAAI